MNAELFALHFTFNHAVVKQNLDGITHEESLRLPKPGGNCLNWVLGHIITSRDTGMSLIGAGPVWSKEEAAPYARGSECLTDPAAALPLERLIADFDRSQELFQEGLAKATPEQLAAKAPFSPRKSDEETVASALTLFAFHEAYHAGQTGLLRRLLGKEGKIR